MDMMRMCPLQKILLLMMIQKLELSLIMVLSKRRFKFANELHGRIETETEVKELKDLVLNAFEPTEAVKVEHKKKPKFAFMRKVLRKLYLRK